MHGVLDGTRFAVYPPDANLANPGEQLSEVEVVQHGGTESLAEVRGVPPPHDILLPGSLAVLLDPGPNYCGTAVSLAYRISQFEEELENEVLEAVAKFLAGTSYLRLAEEGTQSDFQVAVNELHEIEIQDSLGAPVPHLGTPVLARAPGAAANVVARLVHLVKFQAVWQLANKKTPLGSIVVELLGVQDVYDRTGRPDPLPGTRGASVEMQVGQWTFLRISNRSTVVLNISVLDLQPDWEITQILPEDGGANLFPLDARRSFDLPFQAQLPDGIAEGTHLLKVFAVFGPADFRWLELPPLAPPRTRGGVQRNLTAQMPSEWSGVPSEEWVTAQVEVKIKRRQN